MLNRQYKKVEAIGRFHVKNKVVKFVKCISDNKPSIKKIFDSENMISTIKENIEKAKKIDCDMFIDVTIETNGPCNIEIKEIKEIK